MGVVFALVLVVTGCADEVEPIRGQWQADGPQPDRYRDFGDDAEIVVDREGKVSLGRSSSQSLCGGAKLEVDEVTDERASYRIVLPEEDTVAWCLNDVPSSLDVVVKGDTLEATPTDAPTEATYRLKRVS